MIFIDSHCHPQSPQYDEDRDKMINRTLNEGVSMVCVGTDFEMSEKAIRLAREHDGIWASVGLHPNDNLGEKFDKDKYRNLLLQEKVVAMGEVGLDYYRTEEEKDQKIQKKRFEEQLELAKEIKKPVIFHCRDARIGSVGKAHKDMFEILESAGFNIGGVMHSFTGTKEEAKKYLDLGLYLGFNGIITFSKQYDELIKSLPLGSILIETDAPYLTPEPHRGKRNEPSYAKLIAQKISELREVSIEEIAQKTTENTKRLFCLTF